MAPSEASAETWLPHPVHDFYDISDQGRVRSWRNRQYGRRRNSTLMKPKRSPAGYLVLKFSSGGKKFYLSVHRLVLETFVGPCPEGMQGCHGNGNSEDNRLVNLRWDTPKNNYLDRVRHGTVSRHRAVFTDDQVRVIRDLVASGTPQADLARHFGVTKTCIGYIVKRKAYAHIEP